MLRRQKDYICFIFGVMLLVVGAIGLVYPEITLKNTKTVKLGPVTIDEPKKQIFNISPYVAGGIITVGVFFIYIGMKK